MLFPKKYCTFFPGEIRLSLKTGKLKSARQLATLLANKTRGILSEIGKGKSMTITKQKIRSALGEYLQQILDQHEDKRTNEGSFADPSVANRKLTEIGNDIQSQLQGKDGHGQIDFGVH
ncbi:MAG: hypothetical protein GY699_23585 [Desulfobacteraceae bacterium]|nr:hypothetical protein [Desulfobacteraceae bacterium]